MGPGTLGIALTNLLLLEQLGFIGLQPRLLTTSNTSTFMSWDNSLFASMLIAMRSMIEPSLDMMAGALFELIALARVHEYTEAHERCFDSTWTRPITYLDGPYTSLSQAANPFCFTARWWRERWKEENRCCGQGSQCLQRSFV